MSSSTIPPQAKESDWQVPNLHDEDRISKERAGDVYSGMAGVNPEAATGRSRRTGASSIALYRRLAHGP
jgi:hypothetical protein